MISIGNASAKCDNSFLGHLKQKFTDENHVGALFKLDSGSSKRNRAGESTALASWFGINILQFSLLAATKM
jgi:hypothetical protein